MRNLIGKRLKLARNSVNPRVTQADLAARLQIEGINLDRVAISKIELGIRPVSDFELVALAKALGTTVPWLLGEEDPMEKGKV